MAPSPNITASRALHLSTSRVIAQSVGLSIIVPISSLFSIPASQGLAALPSTRRSFWCGRNGFRNKASSNTAIYHKYLEAQQRIAKHRSGRVPIAPIRSGYPFYYARGQGWRLASSWGKSEDKSNQIPNDKSKAEVENEGELKSEAEKWQEELNSYLERFRKRVERYPYETLFGASIRRGVWNPWENQLNHWIRNLAKDEWISSRIASQHQTPSQGSHSNKTLSQTKPAETLSRSTQSGTVPTATESKDNETMEIDLITLRRVQRKAPDSTDTMGGLGAGKEVDIPVKVFMLAKNTIEHITAVAQPNVERSDLPKSGSSKVKESVGSGSSVDSPKKPSTTQEAWLAKEGFSEIREKRSSGESSTRGKEGIPSKSAQQRVPRIESSLDRHLQNLGPSAPSSKDSHTPLVYKTEENKTEDIDLLRASNVRASAGRLKKPVPETIRAREKRRSNLKQRFEEKQEELEAQYTTETANLESSESKSLNQNNSNGQHSVITQPNSSQLQMRTSAGLDTALNRITNEPETTANVDAWGYDLTPKGLETSYQDELDNKVQSLENYFAKQQQDLVDTESQKKQKMLAATNATLEEEIQKQKAAMAAIVNRRPENVQPSQGTIASYAGEGDISQSVHQFVGRGRWYKSKAPHALEEDKQKAKDIALVREIRQIYEDQYGVIDTKHTQPYLNPAMEGKEDPSVQEGLREYEVKIAMEEQQLPTHGKIATTDLDSFEVIRLGQTTNIPDSPSASSMSASIEPSTTEDLKSKSKIAEDSNPELRTRSGTHTYKVLAFDETTQKVATATTTTSVFESSLPPRSVPAILSHLEQPARYFEHFEPLEAAGFELVAGSRNTLVFKQVRKEIHPPTKTMQDTINRFLETDLPASSTFADEGAALDFLSAANSELKSDRNIEHTPSLDIEYNNTVTKPETLNHKDQNTVSDFQKPIETLEKKAKQQLGVKSDLASSLPATPDLTEQTSGHDNISMVKPGADLHDVVINTSWKMNGEQPVDGTALRTGIDAMRPSQSETPVSPRLGSTVNPIDGTTAPQPGFTDSNATNPPINPVLFRPTPRKIVRREEEVFSGRNLTKEQYREQRRQQRLASLAERYGRSKKETSKNRRRVRRAAKRVFFTGTWVAACFYLVGALWEEVYRPRERKRGRVER
ncbi:hypothetical protein MMC34_005903 [Xylographa carneopallida]|nr:hypothetical protein [Xylographa carneopallida]